VRLAWFSPPPGRGLAGCDCARSLLPTLHGAVEIQAFWPGGGAVEGTPLRDPSDFDPRDFDAACFHLGDDPLYLPSYRAAVGHPGVCWFHDRSVHRLLAGSGDRGAYEHALRQDVGPRGSRLASLRGQAIGSDLDPGLIPLSGHLVRRAAAVVADSSWALELLLEEGPGVRGMVVPPPVRLGPGPRASGGDRFAVTIVDPSSTVERDLVPEVLRRLRDTGPDATISEPRGEASDPDKALDEAEVVLSLRRPGHWGWPPALARALALGRPAVLDDLAGLRDLPDGAVFRVPVDGDRAADAAEHLGRMAKDPTLRAEAGARARAYAAEALDPAAARDRFLVFLSRAGEGTPGNIRVPAPRPGPAPWTEARAALEGTRRGIERLRAGALSPLGTPLFVDLAYRLILGRPADEEALRRQHRALGSARRTRAELVRELVESREFAEAARLESLVREAVATGEFPLRQEPAWPETTERVVEMPWVLSRYRGERRVLDIGYAYALDVYLAGLLSLPAGEVHGIDMAESPISSIRRVQGDVRRTPYRDGSFDLVLCVSTLEHIGRDNTRYGIRESYRPGGDAETLREIARILAPDGRLLVTVPFGRRENHGWFVQYDMPAWRELLAGTGLRVEEEEIYRLTRSGWSRVVDVRSTETISYEQGTPAAGAVLCASLTR
jgi:SAM-dependent methyltransferase